MNTNRECIDIALVDDHGLLRHALARMISQFDGMNVLLEATHGKELQEAIKQGKIPHLILLDLSMPVMDGLQTALWLKIYHPEIMILMLTIFDSEITMIRLLQAGVKGFVRKDADPRELKQAIVSVANSGYYYSNGTAGKLANLVREQRRDSSKLASAHLSDLELKFLNLICTELTYKEIATEMKLTPRVVDGLRDTLFVKLDVRSRVTLAMEGIRHGLIRVI